MRGCDSASPPEPAAAMRVAANGYPVSKTDLQENAFWSVLFVKHPPQNGSLWGKHRGDIQPYASRRRLFVNLSTEDTSTNRGLQENAILRHLDCRPLLLFGQFVLKSRGVYSQTPSRSRLFVDPSVRCDYLRRRYQSGPEAGEEGRVTAARK